MNIAHKITLSEIKLLTTKENAIKVLKLLGIKSPKNKVFDILVSNYDYKKYLKIFREIALGLGGKYDPSLLPTLLKTREELIQDYKKKFPNDVTLDWVFNMDGFDDYRKKCTFGKIPHSEFMKGVEKHLLVASISDLTSRITEIFLVSQNEEIFPTLKHSGGVDYFFKGRPKDLKNSKSLGSAFIENCKSKGIDPIQHALLHPEKVIISLYQGQSKTRFGDNPRHLIVSLNNEIISNETLIEKLSNVDFSDEKNITFTYPPTGKCYSTCAVITYI